MAYELGLQELQAIAMGGCFFGSGGGGTLTSAQSLLKHFKDDPYYRSQKVRVVSVEEATDGDAVMVAYLGSPAAIDGAQYPLGPVEAVENVQAYLKDRGGKLGYIAPPESGALGFVVACLVACHLDLAVIDGDGAGRAVPSLPQLTYAAAEVNPRPAYLVSQSGLSVELDVRPRDGQNGSSSHQQDVSVIIDQMMRPIVSATEFHQFGGLAMWIMTPEVLRGALSVKGTLSRALALGQQLQQGRIKSGDQMIDYLQDACGLTARALCSPGEISSVKIDTGNGFDLGNVLIKSGSSSCTVRYQNESLLVWDSAKSAPLCTAPDSIAYFVENPEQQVYSNGDLLLADGTLNPLVKQKTVWLIGIGADPALRKPGGLILESFQDLLVTMGYLGNYVPLTAEVAA